MGRVQPKNQPPHAFSALSPHITAQGFPALAKQSSSGIEDNPAWGWSLSQLWSNTSGEFSDVGPTDDL